MRILLIEDDKSFADCVLSVLQDNGHQADYAATGEDGLALIEDNIYHLIILDLGLPDINGMEAIEAISELRQAGQHLPVIVLSGRTQLEDKVTALDAGADDYMIKPFHRDELLARLGAVMRRNGLSDAETMNIGELTVNLTNQEVINETGRIKLTLKEYKIFELLCMSKGRPVHRDRLLDMLYSGCEEPDVKIVDVFICTLRRKLAAANNGRHYIRTIWGRGYALECEQALAA